MPKRGAVALVCFAFLATTFAEIPGTSATTFPTNVRVNDVTTGDQLNASVAVGPTGIIYVAWEDTRFAPIRAIFYASSEDGGQSFGPSQPVTPAFGDTRQKFPSVAISDDGWVHVVWTDLTGLGTLPGTNVQYARLRSGEPAFDPPVVVSDVPRADGAHFLKPRVATYGGAGCRVHVVWAIDETAVATDPIPMTYDTSRDCGTTFGADLVFEGSGVDVSLDVASDGAVGIAYMANASPGPMNVYFRLMENDVWQAPVQVNDVLSPYHRDPTIALQDLPPADHRAHVAWADWRYATEQSWWDTDIFYSQASSDGTPFPDARIVDTVALDRKEQSEPSIGLDTIGNPKVAWTDWRNDPEGYRDPYGPPGTHDADVYFTESWDGGSSFTANLRVNNDPSPPGLTEQSRPRLFQSGAGQNTQHSVYVVWQDERDGVSDLNVYLAGWRDADGDGLSDWEETTGYYGHPDGCNYVTDPNDADTDDDGLVDGTEVGVWPMDGDPLTWTCPTDADTDDDGLYDGQEDKNWNGMRDGNDPTDTETDWGNGFGLGEVNPRAWDTDLDGLSDGQEAGLPYPVGYTSYAEWQADPGSPTGPAFVPDGDAGGTQTDPVDRDTDDDGMPDGWIDADLDGTRDLLEFEDRDLNGAVDPGAWNGGAGPGETNPMVNDTEHDGLRDDDEIAILGTNPILEDTDNDGIEDGTERVTDPRDADTDDDGIRDGNEDRNRNGVREGDDPTSGDSDWDAGDGVGETDPLRYDTDGDGLSDGQETGLASPQGPGSDTDPTKFKADGDAGATTTDPLAPDGDGDGWPDGFKDANGNDLPDLGEFEDRDLDGVRDGGAWNGGSGPGETDPNRADTDGDAMNDPAEVALSPPANPTVGDTDGGGIPDGWEASQGLSPTNPADDGADPDGDGLANFGEYLSGTRVDDPDSDDDLIGDATDPNPVAYNVDDAVGNTIAPDVVLRDASCGVSVALDYLVPDTTMPTVSCPSSPPGPLQGTVGNRVHLATTAQVPYRAIVKVQYNDASYPEQEERAFLLYFHTGAKWTLPVREGLEQSTWYDEVNNYVWADARRLGDFWIASSTANDLDSDTTNDGTELNVDEYQPRTIQVFSEGNDLDFNSDVAVHVDVPVTQNAVEVVDSLSFVVLSGGAEWSPDYRATMNTYVDEDSDIAVDSGGSTHIVWWRHGSETDIDIMYAKISRIGQILVGPKVISGSGGNYQLWPRLDLDGSGYVHVVWQTDTGGLYYTRLDNNGNVVTGEKQIVTEPVSVLPDIAVDSTGDVHVTWYQWVAADSQWDVFYKRLNNNGDAETGDIRVTNSDEEDQAPQIDTDSGNSAHILYNTLDVGSGYSDRIYHVKVTGTSVSSPHLVSDDDNQASESPAIAVGADNTVFIVWQDYKEGAMHVFFRRLDNSGTPMTAILRISDSTAASRDPSVGTDGANFVYVAWQDFRAGNSPSGASNIFWVKLNANGAAQTPNTRVVQAESYQVAVAVEPSGFTHVSWTDWRHGDLDGDGNTWDDVEVYYKNSAGYPLDPNVIFFSSPTEEGQPQTPNWHCQAGVTCNSLGQLTGSVTLQDGNTQENGNPPMSQEMSDYLDAAQQQDPSATIVSIPIRFHSAQVGRMSTSPEVIVVPLVTDPLQDDADGDYLSDTDEAAWGTNPNDPDHDNDGLKDGLEVWYYGSSPTNPNSDSASPCGDTLLDGFVDTNGNQQWDAGVDQPGEYNYRTNPNRGDTDGDGICDDTEVNLFGPNAGSVDNPSADADSDGLWNGPLDVDSDNDGMNDGFELTIGWTVRVDLTGDEDTTDFGETYDVNPSPILRDSDGDSLGDLGERDAATDPNELDTDNDGLSDSFELTTVYDPTYVVGQVALIPLGATPAYQFGPAGNPTPVPTTQVQDGPIRSYVSTAVLVPGPFATPDFTVDQDWALEVSFGGGFQPAYTFRHVMLNTPQVTAANVNVIDVISGPMDVRLAVFAYFANPNPLLVDTDNDGLHDGWEVNGYDENGDGTVDVDLPAMGAEPTDPDLFFEVDFMDDCSWLSYIVLSITPICIHDPIELLQSSQDTLAASFARHGIELHIDDGRFGEGGTVVPHIQVLSMMIEPGPSNDFRDYYDMFFPAVRHGIFRWALMADDLDNCVTRGDRPSGCGGGDSHAVAAGSLWFDSDDTFVFFHETGHTLGIAFRGVDSHDIPFNEYPSAMNYNSPWNYYDYSNGLTGPNDHDDWGNLGLDIFGPGFP